MTAWSRTVLLVAGIAAGPYGLNLLSPSLLLLLDPAIVSALAMLGVFVGLGIDPRSPRVTSPAIVALVGGVTMAAFHGSPPAIAALIALGAVAVAVVIAFAGWLLVGRADSDREQQVFVVGVLLLLGGSAAYVSLSAVFAGLFAGIAWSAAGDLARARIVHHLGYFQHPLFVVMLLVAGASISFTTDMLRVAVLVAAVHIAGRPVVDPFPVSAGAAAIAVTLDVFRGVLQ